MQFRTTPLDGLYVLDIQPAEDERGFFARTWCAEEARRQGLVTEVVQCSLSYSRLRGTLRGLHFQTPPHAETKLVRCVRGSLYDVSVDLRRASPTFGRWFAAELSAKNRKAVYIPAGFAHGIQTLEDDTEMLYQISTPYCAEASRGVRWDDPALDIPWPLSPTAVSQRDLSWPGLDEVGGVFEATNAQLSEV